MEAFWGFLVLIIILCVMALAVVGTYLGVVRMWAQVKAVKNNSYCRYCGEKYK